MPANPVLGRGPKRTARSRAIVAVAAVLVMAGLGLVARALVAEVPIASTVSAAPVRAAERPLPVLSPSPADPSARVPLVPIGQIAIPKIGVEATIHEGVWDMVIDAGPAHWPGSAMPGEWGKVVIAGHRESHGGVFRRLDQLVPGDTIVLRSATGTFTYSVTGSMVVQPTDVWILDQHPVYELTLFTCHPIGSTAERLVITARLDT